MIATPNDLMSKVLGVVSTQEGDRVDQCVCQSINHQQQSIITIAICIRAESNKGRAFQG